MENILKQIVSIKTKLFTTAAIREFTSLQWTGGGTLTHHGTDTNLCTFPSPSAVFSG